METPILESDRIILKPLTIADADTVYKNWTSDPHVARYMIWDLHKSVADTVEWLQRTQDGIYGDDYQWGFVLKENSQLFGSGGIHYRADLACYELGYNIMEKYWSQGLVTEASRAILDFAKNTLDVTRVFSVHAVENIGSGKVLQKLGFVYNKDSSYDSVSGQKHFSSKEYYLQMSK